jgi:hypothetical protein
MRALFRVLPLMAALALSSPARAYRPFDSTDASVASHGHLELELGPLGYQRQSRLDYLVVPALVVNYGFGSRWEAVLQARNLVLLERTPGEAREQLTDTAVFLKAVLRQGSLQGGEGPSLATEFGCLLPTFHAERGAGATASLLVSQRWDAATLHLNGAISLTRAGHADFFGGAIVEGPRAWLVRPVAELFAERELRVSSALSALAGVIWQADEELSFDAAVRGARVGGTPVYEARAGLTWAIPTLL